MPNVQYLISTIKENQYTLKKYTFVRKGIETKYRLLENAQIISESALIESLFNEISSKISSYEKEQELKAFEQHKKEKPSKKLKTEESKSKRVYEPEPEEAEQEKAEQKQEKINGQEQRIIDKQKEIPLKNKYAHYTKKAASYIYNFFRVFSS